MEENVLLKLNEDQRLARFTKVALSFQKVAEKQLELLKRHEKVNKQKLHPGFLYFIRTLESFWENFNFLFALRRGQYRTMAHYPARSMLETLFRVEYYVKQKREGQNYIAAVETLRIYKRLYDFGTSKGEDVQDIKETYNEFLKLSNLNNDATFLIDKVNENKLNPFPKLEQLIQTSNLSRTDGLYFHYRILCEHSHGKLIASMIRKSDSKQSYRQMLMYGCLFAGEMLKVVDHHIEGATKSEVTDVILKSESIIKAPI